ncbi:peptidoglycan bridge formation glycyltransferase FemA/FemB family protein [Candidatus Saccharibacteria bacterium]|nr:peptidoglycan bridge formation glycyltransferase FemA/FemB family protein [Candidatus Saccharibacteria bacterium]
MKFGVLTEEEFEAFAVAFPTASLLQSAPMARRRELSGWGHDFVGLKNDAGKIVAAALLQRWPVALGYVEYECLQGPLVDFNNLQLASLFLNELREFTAQKKALKLTINPNILAQHWGEDRTKLDDGYASFKYIELLRSAGFHQVATARVDMTESMFRWFFVKNLQAIKSSDELLASYAQQTRWSIRKSQKSGVHVREIGIQELPVFMKIMQATEDRRGYSGHDEAYYAAMVEQFGRERVKLLVAEVHVADYEAATRQLIENETKNLAVATQLEDKKKAATAERVAQEALDHYTALLDEIAEMAKSGATLPIAAAMFVLYGKEMSYVISGALKQYAKYCGPYAIQWYAQQYAVKHSVVRFNFFGTKGNHSGTPSQEGIYKFKAGFGGVLEEQLGYFEVSFHPILLAIKNTLRSLRR